MTRSDKGKKRAHYVQRKRRDRKEIADLKRTQEDIERFEKLEKRLSKPVLTSAERKRKAREERLPADRRCPYCSEVKVESRLWVVKGNVVCCRSCADLMRRLLGAEYYV